MRVDMRTAGLVGLVTILGLLAPDADASVPERQWATYFGGSGGEYQNAVAVDEVGNIYLAGHTESPAQIASVGAFDASLDGMSDAFLVKFDPAGKRLWSTYFGGDSGDLAVSVAVRGDTVVIGGMGQSQTDVATPGTFQSEPSSANNGFVARFTADGALVWATYVAEVASEVAIDPQGDVYAVGSLDNTVHSLASPGAHQTESGDTYDAYLIRLDAVGQRVWGTLLGGEKTDMATGLALGPGDEVYVAGITLSTTAIATPGAHQPALASLQDLFLVRFDTAGARVWGTYYGGEYHEEEARLAALPGGVIVGASAGGSTGLGTPGTHQVEADLGDCLVARFDDQGARVWSTYVGGAEQQRFGGVAVGPADALYVGGATYESPDATTPDAFQTMFAGSYEDGFFARFSLATGQRTWSTYFGGETSDTPVHVAVAPQGLVVAMPTESGTGCASPGAEQPMGGVLTSDACIARFIDNSAPDGAPCDDASTCASAHCVDGVCCADACTGDCVACSVAAGAAVDGTCAPRTGECRPALGECDIGEACDGLSAECPADIVIEDGTPCEEGTCSQGACSLEHGTTTLLGNESNDPSDAQPSSDSSDGPGQDSAGCGCTTGGPPGLLILSCLVPLLRPRRRRHFAGTGRSPNISLS